MNKLTPGHPTARHGAPTTHDATGLRPSRRALLLAWGAALGAPVFAAPGRYPITPGQRATAQGVAEAGGVPEQDLAEGAPETYTVKRGDTLWGISGLYLKQPWRWPELWGMNLADIRNPHLIYPGQVLRLQRKDGRARLATADEGPPTVRLSPRVRSERLGDTAIPTLAPHLIEPFLSEPLVVDERDLQSAPRIVATQENHVLLSRGDRAYAMGQGGIPLTTDAGEPRRFRVYRDVKPLLDPLTREVLGYEAQYVGRVRLLRGEGVSDAPGPDGKPERLPVPATLDVLDVKEEMRVGDRLLPEPERDFATTRRTRRLMRWMRASSPSTAARCALPRRIRSWSSTRARATASRSATCWPSSRPARAWSTRPTGRTSRCACPTNATACSWCSAPSSGCPTAWCSKSPMA